MRKTTRKYLLLLIVVLAVAGFLQLRRLQKQLAIAHGRVEQLQYLYHETLQRLRALNAQIDAAAEIDETENRLPEEERQYYQRRMMRLEERIAFLETAVATVRAPGRSFLTPQDAARADIAGHSPLDILLPVMMDPELRDLLRVQMLATLEHEYEPLLTHYNYDLSDEDTLLALLMEKRWNAMQYRLIMMQDGLDPELRRHALESIRDDQEDLRMVLYDFLGDDDFAIYETYEQMQPERLQVDQLQQQLSRHDILLNEEQQRRLILLLHEANTALDTFVNAAIIDDSNEPRLDPGLADLYREAADHHHQRILQGAQTILTDEQMTFFEDYVAKQRALRDVAPRRNADHANP